MDFHEGLYGSTYLRKLLSETFASAATFCFVTVFTQFLQGIDRVSQARSELLWSVGGRHITGPDDLPAMHPVTQFTASEITLKG